MVRSTDAHVSICPGLTKDYSWLFIRSINQCQFKAIACYPISRSWGFIFGPRLFAGSVLKMFHAEQQWNWEIKKSFLTQKWSKFFLDQMKTVIYYPILTGVDPSIVSFWISSFKISLLLEYIFHFADYHFQKETVKNLIGLATAGRKKTIYVLSCKQAFV